MTAAVALVFPFPFESPFFCFLPSSLFLSVFLDLDSAFAAGSASLPLPSFLASAFFLSSVFFLSSAFFLASALALSLALVAALALGLGLTLDAALALDHGYHKILVRVTLA